MTDVTCYGSECSECMADEWPRWRIHVEKNGEETASRLFRNGEEKNCRWTHDWCLAPARNWEEPMEQRALWMYTIYESPADYPGVFVARRWRVDAELHNEGVIALRMSLDEIRAALPKGLVCLARHPSDDPVIVESWI